jgi:hypothetical protein
MLPKAPVRSFIQTEPLASACADKAATFKLTRYPGMAGTSPADSFAREGASGYIMSMTLLDLEKAVAELAPDELSRFRAWFDEFDAARFDERIERDAKSGKLDSLADAALIDFRSGRVREL